MPLMVVDLMIWISWQAPYADDGTDWSSTVYPPSPHATLFQAPVPSNICVPLSCAPPTVTPPLASIDIPG
jgi:hypothetical protein